MKLHQRLVREALGTRRMGAKSKQECLQEYGELVDKLKATQQKVNQEKPALRKQIKRPQWEEEVKALQRMAHRNPIQFFWQVKQSELLRPLPGKPEIPKWTLQTLMTVQGDHLVGVEEDAQPMLMTALDFLLPDNA